MQHAYLIETTKKKLLVKINFLMKLFICVIMTPNLSLYISVIYAIQLNYQEAKSGARQAAD